MSTKDTPTLSNDVSIDELEDFGTLPNATPNIGPALSAGDLDARWDEAESSGEETAGGSNPTPDQEVVSEIGRALGVTYEEGEPLRVGRKEEERDEHRWELDPASSEDYQERVRGTGSEAERVRKMTHEDQYGRSR